VIPRVANLVLKEKSPLKRLQRLFFHYDLDYKEN